MTPRGAGLRNGGCRPFPDGATRLAVIDRAGEGPEPGGDPLDLLQQEHLDRLSLPGVEVVAGGRRGERRARRRQFVRRGPDSESHQRVAPLVLQGVHLDEPLLRTSRGAETVHRVDHVSLMLGFRPVDREVVEHRASWRSATRRPYGAPTSTRSSASAITSWPRALGCNGAGSLEPCTYVWSVQSSCPVKS